MTWMIFAELSRTLFSKNILFIRVVAQNYQIILTITMAMFGTYSQSVFYFQRQNDTFLKNINKKLKTQNTV